VSASVPQSRGPAIVRLARNGALTAAADILSKLCSLAFFVLIARRLGQETLGHYVFALAMTSLVWSVAEFGFDRMAVRDMARDPGVMDRLVVPTGALKGSSALLACTTAAAILLAAGQGAEQAWLVLILGIGTAVTLAATSIQMVFTAHERMEHVFLTKVPWSFAAAVAGIVVLLAGGGIVAAVAVGSGAVSLAGLAWCWVLLIRHYGRPRLAPEVRSWPALVRRALPFGLQETLGQVIFRFDTVVLALLTTSAVVGVYGAAYRMLEATLFLAWGLGSAVMPIYSYLPAHAPDRALELIYEGSLKLILIVMLPIAGFYLVCAPAIVDLIYGLPRYAGSVGVLRLLAPAVAIYGIGHLAGLLALVRRPGRLTVASIAFVAAFNVVACFVLIALADARGAAYATLASETLLAAFGIALAAGALGRPRLGWTMLSPLLATAALAAAAWPVRDTLWLALPLGGLAYLAALLLAESRRLREDIALFRAIAGNRPAANAMPDAPFAP
jgi:O-antigen/teichoic acid export membrane protein